jgi:hypothetical protein
MKALLKLFLKYCFYIFLMYRLTRKRPLRRPPRHAAADPRPLPPVAGDGSGVEGVPPATLR